MDIRMAQWMPDSAEYQAAASLEALNVIPLTDGSYGPFPSFATISDALTARAQGGFFARKSDGTGVIICGDATKLYKLTGTVFSDVSRVSGGAYGCPSDTQWSFVQFGTKVYAFNGFDNPQQFDIDSDTNFSLMTGSPPIATYATIVGQFIMTGNQPTARQRLQWGPFENNGTWAQDQVTMADQQDEPDRGRIQGITGYDQSVFVFQEFAIKRGTFVGTPLIFQFGLISDQIGLTIPGALQSYRDRIFFVDRSGFYSLLYGTQIIPIGNGIVDDWFWKNLDQNYLPRVTSGIDPVRNIYAVNFPDLTNTGGTPNHTLIHHWPSGWWAHAQSGEIEMMFSGATQSGFTIEDLDIFGTIENVPFPFDSPVWTGLARRLLAGFGTDHKLGFFSGPALAATVDTTEANIIKNKRAFLRSCTPIVQGTTGVKVALGVRERIGDPVVFGTARSIDAYGNAKFRTPSMYHRGRITTVAGSTMTHIQGIDGIVAVPWGTR